MTEVMSSCDARAERDFPSSAATELTASRRSSGVPFGDGSLGWLVVGSMPGKLRALPPASFVGCQKHDNWREILFLPRPEDDFDITVLPRVELSEGHRGVIEREMVADDLAWLGSAGDDHVA
jgi:hypothetical protein